jgi:hypothetical protein
LQLVALLFKVILSREVVLILNIILQALWCSWYFNGLSTLNTGFEIKQKIDL